MRNGKIPAIDKYRGKDALAPRCRDTVWTKSWHSDPLTLSTVRLWGRRKWLSAVAFGCMYMLAEYATFGMVNTVSFHKVNMPNFSMFLAGAAISAIGMGPGVGMDRLTPRSEGKSTNQIKV